MEPFPSAPGAPAASAYPATAAGPAAGGGYRRTDAEHGRPLPPLRKGQCRSAAKPFRPAMRLSRPVLLVLGVAACAAPQAPELAVAEPVPPLARVALAEWDAWGRIVVDGWPEVRPAETATTPERFARLVGYWTTVPGGSGVARRLSGRRSVMAVALARHGSAAAPGDDGAGATATAAAPWPEDIGLYAHPAWSAAFISALVRRAGVPESDLPSSARHAGYIDAVLARAITDPHGARFRPHAPDERAPRPGDLLCADRSAVPLPHWSARLAEIGRPRPMHCDVVVRNGPGAVEVVGGNVQDLVVLRRLPSDLAGRVLPAPSGQPPFVLVLAARDQG
jgi:Uncharacterized protein conserved in bacteria (DUF2272)